MSATDTNDEAIDHHFGDSRDSVRERAEAASLSWWAEDWSTSEEDPDPFLLGIAFPNGTRKRTVLLDGNDARRLDKVAFENFEVLGDYRAVLDRQCHTVEVLLQSARGRRIGVQAILNLPGVIVYKRDPDSGSLSELAGGLDEIEPAGTMSPLSRVRRGNEFTWRLPLAGTPDGMSCEISPASESFLAVAASDASSIRRSSQPTLKFKTGDGLASHDEALEMVEDWAGSILFDLDMRFDIAFIMERIQWLTTPLRVRQDFRAEHAVQFPRLKYAKEATTLYFYGKAATTMPLLQYLAYYQAVEHHYSRFFDAETTEKVRNQLKDPRFDLSSDTMMKRLILVASRGGRGAASEREQLKATIHGSVESSDLIAHITDSNDRKDALTKKGELEGVPWINVKNVDGVLDQVGDRIYAIRCRIVHAKDSTNESFAPPLMPYSKEAIRLGHDIELIEFIARKVIVAGSIVR